MGNNSSPLETLAAFAIVYVAGVVTTMGMRLYGDYIRRQASPGTDASGAR